MPAYPSRYVCALALTEALGSGCGDPTPAEPAAEDPYACHQDLAAFTVLVEGDGPTFSWAPNCWAGTLTVSLDATGENVWHLQVFLPAEGHLTGPVVYGQVPADVLLLYQFGPEPLEPGAVYRVDVTASYPGGPSLYDPWIDVEGSTTFTAP